MEHLNKVELKGIVGTVKVTDVGDSAVARISVATDYIYKDRTGIPVVETTWHGVTVWKEKCRGFADLRKGCAVHVTGRLRTQRYTAMDGSERSFTEVIADACEVIAQPRRND